MSRKKPVLEYDTIVKKIGTSARIVAFKDHIGRKVHVKVEEGKENE